jgi:hypothetical protein
MEKNIIYKIGKIGQIVFPFILIILGILNIVCKIPVSVKIIQGVFLVVVPTALIIFNFIFPSEKTE